MITKHRHSVTGGRALVAIIALCWGAVLFAQTSPTFDVVSIVPNKIGSGVMSVHSQGGRYRLTNGNVMTLIMAAYPLHRFEVIGAPGWITSDRFDVTTTYREDTPTPDFRLMMRALLADRFGFRAHLDTRMVDALVLTKARADGRLGPNLKIATFDCEAWAKLPPAERRVTPAGPTCGMSARPGHFEAGGSPPSSLVASLADDLNQRIVDETGLTGSFDYILNWAPDSTPRYADVPSVYAAVQEQLGLKLEGRRIAAEVLVVDAVRQPTPN